MTDSRNSDLRAAISAYAQVFGRGFLIVTLTSLNVFQVSHRHWIGGFCVGVLISVVWWSNARRSARSDLPLIGFCYGLGAGAGTVAGMVLSALLYG